MPTLRFVPAQKLIEVPAGTLLIEAIRGAGLPIAHGCGQELMCGRCGVRILGGKVGEESAREREVKQRTRASRELRLACTLSVDGDLVITTDYWGPAR